MAHLKLDTREINLRYLLITQRVINGAGRWTLTISLYIIQAQKHLISFW